MFSLIIGFFDGDGCIVQNKDFPNCFSISFVGHSSWLGNFTIMKQFIYNYFKLKDNTQPPKITTRYTTLPQDKSKTKRKYYAATFYIDKTALIHAICQKAIELNLPFLKRKLGKIS